VAWSYAVRSTCASLSSFCKDGRQGEGDMHPGNYDMGVLGIVSRACTALDCEVHSNCCRCTFRLQPYLPLIQVAVAQLRARQAIRLLAIMTLVHMAVAMR
jgi:hypothetical protein